MESETSREVWWGGVWYLFELVGGQHGAVLERQLDVFNLQRAKHAVKGSEETRAHGRPKADRPMILTCLLA